jgi:hypothetical protein
MVPVEEPVQKPGIAAEQLGIGQDEGARAQVARHAEPEAEELGVEQVGRRREEVRLDGRGVRQVGGHAPTARPVGAERLERQRRPARRHRVDRSVGRKPLPLR